MTALGKFLLFFCSWSPAYAMVALIAWDEHERVGAAALAISALSIPIYIFMEHLIFSRAPRSLIIKTVSRRDENMLLFVIAYLPPFFSVDFGKWGYIMALILFYILFAITYVRLDLYYLNPMFVLRSYRTYNITSESGQEYVALVKRGHPIEAGDTIQIRGRDKVLIIA